LAARDADDKLLPALETGGGALAAREADDKLLPALETGGGALAAREADDKLLPALEAAGGASESEADDEVFPAGDEVLPARDADDKLLPALETGGGALAAREADDKLLPALEAGGGASESEADDKVLAAGGVFMAAPEAFPGAMGRTRFRSSLSTCFRNSGLPRLFATLMTSPGMTRRCSWNFTLWGRPLPLIRRSRCSPKTSMAYAISLKAGCCAIFTSLYQADLLISIGFKPRSAQSQPCSPSRGILNIHGSASRAQFSPQTALTFSFSRNLSLRFDRDIFAGCLIARAYWGVAIICAIRSCFLR
jgi:hypothetical protein